MLKEFINNNKMLMMKKNNKIKKLLYIAFSFALTLNSAAAVVSDSDGAAFTTKKELEDLKQNFAKQIEQYNTSLDNKIDGAIATYLDGIDVQARESKSLLLYGGRTLGLIENENARPYVEGVVGGRIDFTLQAASGGQWTAGIQSTSNAGTSGTNPSYFKTCFHRFVNDSVPFKYAVVDVNKSDGNYYFNLLGYSTVIESINALHRTHKEADLTQRGAWSIGLCSGFYSGRYALEEAASSYTNNFAEFCEATARTSGRGTYATRGQTFDDHHNQYLLTWKDLTISSKTSVETKYGYITNTVDNTVYNGIRTRDWHGINATNGTSETHTKGDFHMWGWKTAESRGNKFNFHIDAPVGRSGIFADGAGVFDRVIEEDSSYQSGENGHLPATMTHGVVADESAFHNLYKADIGGELKSDNLYSSELADAIKNRIRTGLMRKSFSGVEQDISPIYLGLPITDVKEGQTVEIELDLLDNEASYDIAFTIDGFKNEPISQSLYEDAGCKIEGLNSHILNFPSSRVSSKQKIKLEITKSGILFLKYGASGGTTQYIQLPTECMVVN